MQLRYAIRSLIKSPAFSIVVIATLALTIGGNGAVFSAIDAVLLRPLPFPNPDQLLVVHEYNLKLKTPESLVAPIRLAEWNRMSSGFQGITGYYTEDVSETSGPLPEKVTRALVAPQFLGVLKVSPQYGRDFSQEEEKFGGPSAVLISYRFWQRRFHGDPNAIGKVIRLGKASCSIVGVMPETFTFPNREVELWSPSPVDAPYAQYREATWYVAIGRLQAGKTEAQARADLNAVQSQLGKQYPRTDSSLTVGIQPLKESVVEDSRRSLWILFGSVSLLLIIACTNIAALLLARNSEREREIAIRFSLGASRASVIGDLMAESFLLAITGSVIGLYAATELSTMFRKIADVLPGSEPVVFNWHIALYTLCCAVVVALLCGLVPALQSTQRSIAAKLTSSSGTQVSTQSSLRWILVGLQVAFAVVLLVGAGLLLRSLQKLGTVAPGFEASHILTFRISASWGEIADSDRLGQRVNRALEALRTLPGVEAAALSGNLPGMPGEYKVEVRVVEKALETDRKIVADSRFVSSGYFETMHIPMIAGAACRDGLQPHTAVVNQKFADTYLAGSRAIGRHVQIVYNNSSRPPFEISGISRDAREQGIREKPFPTIYWCSNSSTPNPFYLVRVHGDPAAMANSVRRKIHDIEPARSVFDILPLQDQLDAAAANNKFRTILLTLFGLMAILLVSMGLYGTLNYLVTVRQREIGLRLALGASRAKILAQFIGRGLSVSFASCCAGLCLSLMLAHLLAAMLYGISPSDPITLILVILLVTAVAALASLVPAIRAVHSEPSRLLRNE